MKSQGNSLHALYLPQLGANNHLDYEDISLAAGIFVQLLRYENPQDGDFIKVEWISTPNEESEIQTVKEFQVDDSTTFPLVFSFSDGFDFSLGEHTIRYSVEDSALNKVYSPDTVVVIEKAEQVFTYPAPVFEYAKNGVISEEIIREYGGVLIKVNPYEEIEIDDEVSLFYTGFDSDNLVYMRNYDEKLVDAESLESGVEFMIPEGVMSVSEGMKITAFYNIKKKGIRAGISDESSVVISAENSGTNNLDVVLTSGAAITDGAIAVKPFNHGVIKGNPGASVTMVLDGTGAEFDNSKSNESVVTLDENGLNRFKISSTSTGGYAFYAQYSNNASEKTTSHTFFSNYYQGQGNLKYINNTTGALADGLMPCSFYVKTENLNSINHVRVSVTGDAIISGYDGQQADIQLNADKSAEINITDVTHESVTVKLSLFESSGSYNEIDVDFVKFDN